MRARLSIAAATLGAIVIAFANQDDAMGANADAGSALSAVDIQRVVQQNVSTLKQTCWGRDAGATSEVRLTVHFVISPSGQIQSVSASGADASVNHCAESVVATWIFPASSGPTTVDVPFHLVH